MNPQSGSRTIIDCASPTRTDDGSGIFSPDFSENRIFILIHWYKLIITKNIATCQTEESKLAWVFKLYDVDNDGIIDVYEMAHIMEIMDCLESRYKEIKDVSYCDSTIDIDDISQTTPLERAQNLFNCIEHENEDTLTREEFIAGIIETGAKK